MRWVLQAAKSLWLFWCKMESPQRSLLLLALRGWHENLAVAVWKNWSHLNPIVSALKLMWCHLNLWSDPLEWEKYSTKQKCAEIWKVNHQDLFGHSSKIYKRLSFWLTSYVKWKMRLTVKTTLKYLITWRFLAHLVFLRSQNTKEWIQDLNLLYRLHAVRFVQFIAWYILCKTDLINFGTTLNLMCSHNTYWIAGYDAS